MTSPPSITSVAHALELSAAGHGLSTHPADPGKPMGYWTAHGTVRGTAVTITEGDDAAMTVLLGTGARAVLSGGWAAEAIAGLIIGAAGLDIS